MTGPWIHDIDPVLFEVAGVYFWWYGLSYALGFLNIHLFLRRSRESLGLTEAQASALTMYFCAGVLAGGRLIEVTFDEWPFYKEHPGLIPALWLGGMATHGLLLGAGVGTYLFCRRAGVSFRRVADALVIPGAFLMGLGRIGNFIDGQIVGGITDVPWAVHFPYHDGYRHPVVLYDGLKNLCLVPYLVWIRRTHPVEGAVAARFVFWYAAPRVIIDLFRDYPTHRLALGTGQTLNLVMVAVGSLLLLRSRLRRLGRLSPSSAEGSGAPRLRPAMGTWSFRVAFTVLLVFSLAMPSNWTQDVPEHYRGRHPSMRRSVFYPRIETRMKSAPLASSRHLPPDPLDGGCRPDPAAMSVVQTACADGSSSPGASPCMPCS